MIFSLFWIAIIWSARFNPFCSCAADVEYHEGFFPFSRKSLCLLVITSCVSNTLRVDAGKFRKAFDKKIYSTITISIYFSLKAHAENYQDFGYKSHLYWNNIVYLY